MLQGELLAALLLCQSDEAIGAATESDDYNIVQDQPLDLTVTDKVVLVPFTNEHCTSGKH